MLINLVSFLIALLPRSWALKLGRGFGIASYYIFQRRRKIALENLHQALGNQLSPIEEQQIIKNVFINLGINIIEFFRMQEITKDNLSQYVTFHGFEHLEKAYARNQGILALTAHIGNWEILAGAIALKGFNTAVVVKTARQKMVNDFIVQQRAQKGVKLFSGRNLIRDLFKHLKQGGLVGVILDQSAIKRDGVVVPFFGRHASTMKSLAILSLRSNAAILPIYTYREGFHHHIVIEPEIIHPTETTPEEDIHQRTLLYTQCLESAIRQHPDQWIWTHNRWKIQG